MGAQWKARLLCQGSSGHRCLLCLPDLCCLLPSAFPLARLPCPLSKSFHLRVSSDLETSIQGPS